MVAAARLVELLELERTWTQAHPRRAAGALNAMSGFSHQFCETLLAAVRSFAADRPTTRAELLSDLTVEGEDRITITQVKTRGTRRSVLDAVEELWEIHVLARTTAPELATVLEYAIQVGESARGSLPEVLAEWRPTGGRDRADFVDRLSLRVRSSPAEELYVALVRDFRPGNPVEWTEHWLGRLMRSCRDVGTLALFSEDLWGELCRLENARQGAPRTPFHIWSDGDQPPDEIVAGDYLTGKRPQLADLREGRFATRTERLREALRDLRSWLAEDAPRALNDGLVPVFWIRGRSGAGKSVLLLQLLAAAQRERLCHVLWLGDKTEALPEASATASDLSAAIPVIIGLDDPYQAAEESDRHWRKFLASIEGARQDGRTDAIPWIVCCGPTEQADHFGDDHVEDVVVTHHELAKESAADYEQLRTWFTRRTGISDLAAPASNVLLVQLLFEWRQGMSLERFAARFRRRLTVMDGSGATRDAVTTILAANRLYVGYPRAALHSTLSAPALDKLQVLLDEEHLAVQEHEHSGQSGLWFAHPHLANEIYDAWFKPRRQRTERAAHLRDVAYQCLRYGESPGARTAVLWAVARALTDVRGDLRDRIDRQATAEVLAALHSQRSREGHAQRYEELPVWIALSQAPTLAARLAPDPVTVGLEKIVTADRDEVGLRLTCHRLLLSTEQSPQAPAALAAVEGLLARSLEWREWIPVAVDLASRLGDADRMARLVLAWFEANPGTSALTRLGRVVERILATNPRIDTAHELALALLPIAPHSADWAEVARTVVELRRRNSLARVVDWLVGSSSSIELERVIRLLVASTTPEEDRAYGISALAVRWLDENTAAPPAQFVLEALLASDLKNAEVQRIALARLASGAGGEKSYLAQLLARAGHVDGPQSWLRGEGWDSRGWAFVWRDLWVAAGPNDELSELALDWLRVNEEHASWAYVLEDLRSADVRREELEALALPWLLRHGSHPSWGFVWKPLMASTDSEALRTIGRDWLDDQYTNPSWSHTWEALWFEGDADGTLRALALHWLHEHSAPSWHYVWNALWLGGPERELAVIALARLEAEPDHRSWGHLWLRLWAGRHAIDRVTSRADGSGLTEVTFGWLGEHPEHPSWGYVWRELWRSRPPAPQVEALVDLAVDWLQTQPDHPSWSFVWFDVWGTAHQASADEPADGRDLDDARRARLRDAACDWLDTHPLHQAWQPLWLSLRTVPDPGRRTAEVATRWLVDQPQHQGWRTVWANLAADPGPGHDVDIIGIAECWLHDHPRHPSWAYVWKDLRAEAPDDRRDALTDIALRRLREEPDESGWHVLWRELRATQEDRDDIEAIGLRWLDEQPDHPARGFVFHDLATDLGGTARDALLEHGERWLRDRYDHSSWAYIWRDLRAGFPAPRQDTLVDLALTWLGEQDSHASWAYVWKDLWSSAPDRRGALIDLARRWLRDRTEHPSWSYMWQELHDLEVELDGSDRLADLARPWLRHNPGNQAWGFFWQSLLRENTASFARADGDDIRARFATERTELIEIADGWLQGNPRHRAWGHVFRDLYEMLCAPERDRLRRVAIAWLRDRPEHPVWSSVWLDLTADDVGRPSPELTELGRRWLDAQGARYPHPDEVTNRPDDPIGDATGDTGPPSDGTGAIGAGGPRARRLVWERLCESATGGTTDAAGVTNS